MKILLIILLSMNIAYAKKNKYIDTRSYDKKSKEFLLLMKYPFKPEYAIGYLNSGRQNPKVLRKIYVNTNNKTIQNEINKQMKNKKVFDTNNQIVKLFKFLEENNIKKINNNFTDKTIYKIREENTRGIIFSIKAAINKDINNKNYKKYKEKALKYLEVNEQYYYLMYKSMYSFERYLVAYDYLKYLQSIDSYKYIEEDLFDVCYEGSVYEYNKGNYRKSWILSIEGMKYIDKIDYNWNINKVINLKDILFKSNQNILSEKNKKKEEISYILQETKKYLIGENK